MSYAPRAALQPAESDAGHRDFLMGTPVSWLRGAPFVLAVGTLSAPSREECVDGRPTGRDAFFSLSATAVPFTASRRGAKTRYVGSTFHTTRIHEK